MTLADWMQESYERFRREPPEQALRDSVYQFYLGAWRALGDIYEYGTPIYSQEWDVLVILDACRYDQFRAIAPEFAFADKLQATYSVGSASEEWLAKNFGPERADEMAETVYVTGNPFSRDFFTDEFLELDEVWRYAWDRELGTIRAEPITDRAIAHYRAHEPDRMIVHYMQPHRPFVTAPSLDGGLNGLAQTQTESDAAGAIWDRLRDDELSRKDVNDAFIDNLRYALNDVSRLLSNIDADRVVLTADHGNLLGDHGLYDHPIAVPHPLLRRVPWCPTSARNTADETPRSKAELTTDSAAGVEERLESLGYL